MHVSPTFAGPTAIAAMSSEQLLQVVAAGGEDALAELYDRYGGLAYALALRVLRDRHYAEDAVQDAFVTVWRTAAGFRAERGGARGWILTLVHRRAVDRVRREQRHADLGSRARRTTEPAGRRLLPLPSILLCSCSWLAAHAPRSSSRSTSCSSPVSSSRP